MEYRNFDLMVDDYDADKQRFAVCVYDSPAGQGEYKESVSIADELEFLLRKTRSLARSHEPRAEPDIEEQMLLGRHLFDSIFQPHARDLYERSLMRLHEDQGLRLRLRLPMELSPLPWECLYKGELGTSSITGFLALDPRISIVRALPKALPVEWFEPVAQHRLIVAMASPRDSGDPNRLPALDNLPEEQRLIKKLLKSNPGISAVFLPSYDGKGINEVIGVTLKDLQSELRNPADIFHFSGHGEFRSDLGPRLHTLKGKGYVIFSCPDNEPMSISADDLAMMLKNRGIKLVILGACETAKVDMYCASSSVATSLVDAGISAVVAMQFKVFDSLAAVFVADLYEALVAGRTIDEAVSLGRAAMRIEAKMDPQIHAEVHDWGAPVLYTRSQTGRVFGLIEDEGIRHSANSKIGLRSYGDRLWWAWLATDCLASAGQIDQILATKEIDKLPPFQTLLLLRSAVAADYPARIWLEQLRAHGSQYVNDLDNPELTSESGESSALQEEQDLLGLHDRALPPIPDGVGPVAWSAACHPDAEVRQTAALCLCALESDDHLDRLGRALQHIEQPVRRNRRKWEIYGALADGGCKLPPMGPWDRFGVWWWRFRRRLRDDGPRIKRLFWRGSIGAGIGYAVWRLLIAILATGPATYSRAGLQFITAPYLGFLYAIPITLALGLAGPLLLYPWGKTIADKVRPVRGEKLLAFLLGTLGFGVWHATLSFLLETDAMYFLQVTLLGAIAGGFFNAAVFGQPYASQRQRNSGWVWRLLFAVAALVVPQLLAFMSNENWATLMNLTPSDIDVRFNPQRYSCLLCIMPFWKQFVRSFSQWNIAFSILDAAVTGVVFALGLTFGIASEEKTDAKQNM